jgi:hypothetical protein
VKDQRGVVYLEMLIGFVPVFMFFYGTLQVADASVAHLVVEHAATAAARAAVVVLPDDGAYYEDAENALVDQNRAYRQSDVERSADTILAANPRLDLSYANVRLDKPAYADRELVTAQVSAPYHCLVKMFCPTGLVISASAQLVYQGARYKYEPSTGWASSAASRALSREGEKKKRDEEEQKRRDDRPNTTDSRDDGHDKGDKRPDDRTPDDDKNSKRSIDDLRSALPKRLRDVPITRDPSLEGSTVRVHYTRDERGVITGIEVRVGRDADTRHIADHVATIRVMQRYQGASGKARALVQRFTSWLTGHPNAGPGTLAWETRREIEKLTGIVDERARQLEDPSLTKEQRAELEREVASYEKQLADYEAALGKITQEPGRGFVAADDTHGRSPAVTAADRKVADDLDKELRDFRNTQLKPEFDPNGKRQGTAAVGRSTIPGLDQALRGGSPNVGGTHTTAPRILENDGSPRSRFDAEVDVVNRFLADVEPAIQKMVDAELAQMKQPRSQEEREILREEVRKSLLEGQTLYIHVEQPPCSSCKAGERLGPGFPDSQGVLAKFAEQYPGLRIVVTARAPDGSIDTSLIVGADGQRAGKAPPKP